MKKILVSLMASAAMTFGICSTSFAAPVGYVNMQVIVNSYPGIRDIAQQIAGKQAAMQKDFDNKAKSLDDKGKLELQAKMNKELGEFEDKKMAPIQKNIKETVLKVANAKGIDSVVSNNAMVAGGEDLTEAVVKALKK